MTGLQAVPTPAGGHSQHGIRQGAQVIGHLLHREHALHVPRQRAELLGVMGTAQQVEQAFFVVFASALQGLPPSLQFGLKFGSIETADEQVAPSQLVDHTGMLQQITCRPFGCAQQAQQPFMHRRALQHQCQITLATQQGFDPVDHAQHGLFAHAAVLQPLGGALQQAHQAAACIVAQSLHTRVGWPLRQALADAARENPGHVVQFGRLALAIFAVAAFAFTVTAKQGVELLCHHFSVCVQIGQKCTAAGITQGPGNPGQVVVAGGQHMGLLVVEVLDAVLNLAQKHIGRSQSIGCGLGHEPCLGHALQRVQRGARAQLRKLPTAHHLQQLHSEFDLADATTRQLDVIGAFGVTRAAFGRMVADLLVQRAQRFKNVVVEVAAKHKGQHHAAQSLRRAVNHGAARGHDPAFHPGKALPLAALHLQILFQGVERDHARARVAVGPQGQIDPKHKAVLSGITDQGVHALDGAGEVILTRDFVAAFTVAQGFAVLVVHINQVDVTGHVQFTGTQLAHADDPHFSALPICLGGHAMQHIQVGHDLLPGDVEGDLSQPGHAVGHHLQRGLPGAIQLGQAL